VPSLESLFVATFALLGLRLGLRPLGDNSLFIHLRTGLDLVETGRVPRVDPYSFTAVGEPWVVQSWLVSLLYGAAEAAGGFPLVRLLHGVLYGSVGWLLARLARTGAPARTALASLLVVGVGVVYWSPRPLVVGILGLALTVTVVERRRPWWLLIPIVWVWTNSHGSFVLGLGWLVLVAAGEWLDGGRRRSLPAVAPWIGGFALGLVAACINPLGPRLLVFPLTVVGRREAFAHVVEWRSPSFQSATGLFTLACLIGIVVVLARSRPPWRDVLPVAAFLLAGLAAQRNLPMAAVVGAPVLGRAFGGAGDPPRGSAGGREAPVLHLALAGALAALAAVFVAVAARQPAFDFDGYPVAASRLLDRPARLATTDVAAGYLVLHQGADANVLIDDRVDLYPVRLTKDYLVLLEGRPGALDVLDRYGVDSVLWEDDRALHAQLAASERWRRVGTRDGWAVWVRTAG